MNEQTGNKIPRRRVLQAAGAGAAAMALGPGALRIAQAATSAGGAALMAGDVSFRGTGFQPMAIHMLAGQTLAIHNDSKLPLKMESASTAPVPVTASATPGQVAKVRFDKPGLYLVYDAHGTRFDPKVGQVVAKKGAPNFPLPAYAAILVTDSHGAGLALTSPNVNIPDTSMTFTPWSIVVSPGQAINFTNNDSDLHVAMPSPAPMLMPQSGPGDLAQHKMWMEKMQLFAPLTLGGGASGVITISQPGLHHYYCPIHCAYDANRFTFAPLPSYGGFPFVMDGVIVVVPR